MKSMTDFIMEQEITNTSVEEVFEESTLVSDYMGLCAATKMMECVCEFATIGAFCESNEIAVPTVIQEGWAEFWDGFKNFFKNIAEWFKSLVKGTIAAVTKASLPQLIAKIRQKADLTKEVDNDKIGFMARFFIVIWNKLDEFKELVSADSIDKLYDVSTNNEFKSYNNKLIADLENLRDDLNEINKDKSWKDDGKLKNIELKSNGVTDAKAAADSITGKLTYEKLAGILETINAVNIPKTGEKMLKEFKFSEDQFKAIKEKANKLHTPDEGESDDTKNLTKGTKYVSNQVDKDLVKNIKKVADGFATAYDKITQGLIALSNEEFGSKEIKDQEKFDADVRRAENATKGETLSNTSRVPSIS